MLETLTVIQESVAHFHKGSTRSEKRKNNFTWNHVAIPFRLQYMQPVPADAELAFQENFESDLQAMNPNLAKDILWS